VAVKYPLIHSVTGARNGLANGSRIGSVVWKFLGGPERRFVRRVSSKGWYSGVAI
jgi:hypothetical protein